MGRNRSGFRSLDKLVEDPRVEDIWSEQDTGDGIWVQLARGFKFDGDCSYVHEATCREVLEAMRERVHAVDDDGNIIEKSST